MIIDKLEYITLDKYIYITDLLLPNIGTIDHLPVLKYHLTECKFIKNNNEKYQYLNKYKKLNIYTYNNILVIYINLIMQYCMYELIKDINQDFILITFMEDLTIPFQNDNDIFKILDLKHLIKWASTNVNLNYRGSNFHKLQIIPIGLPLSRGKIIGDKSNDISGYIEVPKTLLHFDSILNWFEYKNIDIKKRICCNDKKLLYTKMTIMNSNKNVTKTNKIDCRNKVHEHLKKNGFEIDNTKVDWLNYIEELYNHKFVIAFPGAGYDCYRIWESLYAGVIPILLKSDISDLYLDLPVLIVDENYNITEEFLNGEYIRICNDIDKYDYNKLTIKYWINNIFTNYM